MSGGEPEAVAVPPDVVRKSREEIAAGIVSEMEAVRECLDTQKRAVMDSQAALQETLSALRDDLRAVAAEDCAPNLSEPVAQIERMERKSASIASMLRKVDHRLARLARSAPSPPPREEEGVAPSF